MGRFLFFLLCNHCGMYKGPGNQFPPFSVFSRCFVKIIENGFIKNQYHYKKC